MADDRVYGRVHARDVCQLPQAPRSIRSKSIISHPTFPPALNVSRCITQDFSTDHAFLYLDKFRHRYPLFSDDIQGTGAVVLSGFINAAKLSSAASGRPLSEHRILFLGAGSAGVGVAMQLMSFFKLQGLSEAEARSRIYLIDSQGLIFDSRGPMAEHKKCTIFFLPHAIVDY